MKKVPPTKLSSVLMSSQAFKSLVSRKGFAEERICVCDSPCAGALRSVKKKLNWADEKRNASNQIQNTKRSQASLPENHPMLLSATLVSGQGRAGTTKTKPRRQ